MWQSNATAIGRMVKRTKHIDITKCKITLGSNYVVGGRLVDQAFAAIEVLEILRSFWITFTISLRKCVNLRIYVITWLLEKVADCQSIIYLNTLNSIQMRISIHLLQNLMWRYKNKKYILYPNVESTVPPIAQFCACKFFYARTKLSRLFTRHYSRTRSTSPS